MSIDRTIRACLFGSVVFLAVVGLRAQKAGPTALELFQQALAAERSAGDLSNAISLYERAASEAGNDRALAVRALLHQAECYEKLGSPEARRIYERIVTTFKDQPSLAAIARARMPPVASRPAPPVPKGLIDSGRGVGELTDLVVGGQPSPNGHWYAFRRADGRLALRELQPGKSAPDVALAEGTTVCGAIVWSANSARVVLPLCDRRAVAPVSLALVDVPSGSRRVIRQDATDWVPLDWSRDATSILALDPERRLVSISAVDGTTRRLQSPGKAHPSARRGVFSADGRVVFYTPDDGTGIIVLRDDGSEQPLFTSKNRDAVIGLDAGGRLLFLSDRRGAFDIWSVQLEDGVATGAAVQLAADVGPLDSIGLTVVGRLYFTGAEGRPDTVTDIYRSSTSPDNVHVVSEARPIARPGTGHMMFPVWSRDGRELAYKVGPSGLVNDGAIEVMTVVTGSVRRVASGIEGTINQFDWSGDGKRFVAHFTVQGREAIYVIDAATGAPKLLADGHASVLAGASPGRGNLTQPRWMPDGQSVVFVADSAIRLHDTVSDRERTIVDFNLPVSSLVVSPDGQSLAVIAGTPATGRFIEVVAVADGSRRRLSRVLQNTSGKQLCWSPDGRFLLLADQRGEAKPPGVPNAYAELWAIGLDGTEPVPIGLAAPMIFQPALSPDGRQLLFSAPVDVRVGVKWLDLTTSRRQSSPPQLAK